MAYYERAIQAVSHRRVVLRVDQYYSLMVPQPLSRQERFAILKANAVKLVNLIESQEHQASLQWLDNMEEKCKPAFKCMEDNLRHANRRTCPKTNETDRRRQPLARNVTGYMSFDQ